MATRPPAAVDPGDWQDVDPGDWQDVQPASAQPVGATAALSKVEGISPTPGYQRRISIPGTDWELPSVEQLAEYLPAAVATGAGMIATESPVAAGALGSMAGEAGRQLVRRAVGAPAATGIAQQALRLDPNSPEAAVAGLASENLAGVAGSVLGRLMKAGSKAIDKSALRSINNLIQAIKKGDRARWIPLAERARAEGLVPAGSSRAQQVALAEAALADAKAAKDAAVKAAARRGATINSTDLVDKAFKILPDTLPGGQTPATGASARFAAEGAAEDALTAAASHSGDMPVKAAIRERQRLDTLLKKFYGTGADTPPENRAAIKRLADIYRSQINAIDEIGPANKRLSELIKLNRIMKAALEKAEFEGFLGPAASEAGAAAAGAVGRLSIPAMLVGRAGVTAGPVASTMVALKTNAAKLLRAGVPLAQLPAHAADLFTEEEARQIEREGRAAAALRAQGEGVTTP